MDATATHTPGPWFSNHAADIGTSTDYPIDVHADERGGYIATVHGAGHHNGTSAANARLIASAPAMLAALRACLDSPSVSLAMDCAGAREQARAAISAATA